MRKLCLCGSCQGYGTTTVEDGDTREWTKITCQLCQGSGRVWVETTEQITAFVNEPKQGER